MTPSCAGEAPACEDESLTEAPSRWAGLPSELLIAVVAKHAPHARSLPELLAASRVCRAWAAAFRDDTLWQALHAALSLPAGETDGTAAAARPQPSWRERVAAATLGLSLVDRGTGPGATELPLQEAFGEARILRDAASCVYGGHLCVLSRGRLMVAHLPGLRGVTSVLQSVRARVRRSWLLARADSPRRRAQISSPTARWFHGRAAAWQSPCAGCIRAVAQP